MARPRAFDEIFQHRAAQLVTECDSRDEEESSDASMATPFYQKQEPQQSDNDERDRFSVQVCQEREDGIKEPIAQVLIAEVEQVSIQFQEELVQSELRLPLTAQTDFLLSYSRLKFLIINQRIRRNATSNRTIVIPWL